MPLNFRLLALLWLPVSGSALFLLFWDRAWLNASGLLSGLAAVRLEQWVALGLLAVQVWFLFRARGPRSR